MKRVSMTLSYQEGDEDVVLGKAVELYKQWDKNSDPTDELRIDIYPESNFK